MAAATMALRFRILFFRILILDGRSTSAFSSDIIVSRGKGGFPQIVQVHMIPERLEGGNHNGGGGLPLIAHPVYTAYLVLVQDKAREFVAATGIPHH